MLVLLECADIGLLSRDSVFNVVALELERALFAWLIG